ncbi:hypothetical protein [Jeotgalibacillus haloalkalitolerans]|nr:hypothetical protein [Jeotgalibacillus sp. HH7-29]
MTIKKFWLSLIFGMVIGVLISLLIYPDDPLFFQYSAEYPGASMMINEMDFNMLFNYLVVIFISVLVIFSAWTIFEKRMTKHE